MKYEVNGNLMNGLVNYLVSRPYAEVVQLLQAIQQVKGIPEAGDQLAPQAAPETPLAETSSVDEVKAKRTRKSKSSDDTLTSVAE